MDARVLNARAAACSASYCAASSAAVLVRSPSSVKPGNLGEVLESGDKWKENFKESFERLLRADFTSKVFDLEKILSILG